MGDVISKTASVDRIVADFRATLECARSRGGEVQILAEARLAPLEAVVATAMEQIAITTAKADKAWAELIAVDADSDATVGAILEQIWAAMGRPGSSPDYTLIAGNGKSQWTDGDPMRQQHGMRLLARTIRMSTHPGLQDAKDAWAERLESKAALQESKARPADEAMAEHEVANASLRAIANSVQLALTRLKRDYKNLGLSETQIHEIIPDQERTASSKPKTTNGQQPTPVS